MKSKFGKLVKNNVGKILGAFIFAFMCCGVMMPVHAFAANESITGKLTLELASSGGGDSASIDASTSTSTGEFNFFPLILGILAVGLIVLLVYLYKTGKLKNKTLSIFALCLVVSVGFGGAKSIIANAADTNDLKADNVSSSAYLKFNEAGVILENNFEIINNTTDTITIENVTSDSEYASILPELKGTKVAGNSTFTAKLKCESIPDFAIEKVKENQGKIEIDGFYTVAYEKEQPVPTGEAYGYVDGETLVLTYDWDRSAHELTYDIPTEASSKEDWDWCYDEIRWGFTKVIIDESFANYYGLKSTAYMFASFSNCTSISGLQYLNTSNVENMSYMFSDCSAITTLNINFDFTNTSNMNYMFSGCTNLTLDCSKWNVKADCTNEGFSNGASGVTPPSVWPKNPEAYAYKEVTNDEQSGNWVTTLVLTYDTESWKHRGSIYTNLPTAATQKTDWPWNSERSHYDKIKINQSFANFDKLTSMNQMFCYFRNVTSIEGCNYLNTSNVTDMFCMVYSCTKLTKVDFEANWNITNVKDARYVFAECSVLQLDCANWQVNPDCNHEGFNEEASGVKLPSAWDSGSLAYSQDNENNSLSDNAINNQEANNENSNADALTPDTQQDKSSSTDADTKDNTIDNKSAESEKTEPVADDQSEDKSDSVDEVQQDY